MMNNNKEIKIGKLYRTEMNDVMVIENIKSDSRGNRMVYYYYLGEDQRIVCLSEVDLMRADIREI